MKSRKITVYINGILISSSNDPDKIIEVILEDTTPSRSFAKNYKIVEAEIYE